MPLPLLEPRELESEGRRPATPPNSSPGQTPDCCLLLVGTSTEGGEEGGSRPLWLRHSAAANWFSSDEGKELDGGEEGESWSPLSPEPVPPGDSLPLSAAEVEAEADWVLEEVVVVGGEGSPGISKVGVRVGHILNFLKSINYPPTYLYYPASATGSAY